MNNGIYNIINSVVVLIAAIIGFLASLHQQKWGRKQSRKDSLLDKRMKVYGEGLEFVYEVEQNQTNAEELERIRQEWKKWYPSNAVYLPPSVNDPLFEAMNWTVLIIIDLHNRDKNMETWKEFKEKLRKAKTFLMDLKDIGWLPKDLK